MGNRFKKERYDRPGGTRSQYVWPGRMCKKIMVRRIGDVVIESWRDSFTTRRENNRKRRAADRIAEHGAMRDYLAADVEAA